MEGAEIPFRSLESSRDVEDTYATPTLVVTSSSPVLERRSPTVIKEKEATRTKRVVSKRIYEVRHVFLDRDLVVASVLGEIYAFRMLAPIFSFFICTSFLTRSVIYGLRRGRKPALRQEKPRNTTRFLSFPPRRLVPCRLRSGFFLPCRQPGPRGVAAPWTRLCAATR